MTTGIGPMVVSNNVIVCENPKFFAPGIVPYLVTSRATSFCAMTFFGFGGVSRAAVKIIGMGFVLVGVSISKFAPSSDVLVKLKQ